MELYGIDDQKVTLRKELEIPDTDLNTYGDSIEEKLELRKKKVLIIYTDPDGGHRVMGQVIIWTLL